MKASRLVARKTISAQRSRKPNDTNNTLNSTSPTPTPQPASSPKVTTSQTSAKTTSPSPTKSTILQQQNTYTKQAKTTTSSEDQLCNICAQNVPGPERDKIFAFGKCDHYVCYVCSARLRVVCEESECPMCREKLDYVLFSESKAKPFTKHNLKDYIFNEKFKIYFENETIKESFEKLLIYECQLCCKQNKANKQQVDSVQQAAKNAINNDANLNKTSKKIEEDAQGLLENFQFNETRFNDVLGLKNHLNYVHKLKLCDLCLTHNRLFSFEYSYYDKLALKKHTEAGEPKTSHKGHPKCVLCHQTFFNNEELITHMSREHYHCHLCARRETNVRIYFLDYRTLRDHFKSRHILCEKDNCRDETFTSVFDDEIEYKFHLIENHSAHAANMSRGEARHQRTLTLEHPGYRSIRDGADSNYIHNRRMPNTAVVNTGPLATANNTTHLRPPESIREQLRQQRMPSSAEFPALGNSSANPSSQAIRISTTREETNHFPSLPTTSANIDNTNNAPATTTVSTSMRHRVTAGPSSSGLAKTFVRSAGGGCRPPEQLNEMDFPPLPEQPKPKATKKLKVRPKKDKEELTLDQLIGSSLSLSGKNKMSKKLAPKGANVKASKRGIKFEL